MRWMIDKEADTAFTEGSSDHSQSWDGRRRYGQAVQYLPALAVDRRRAIGLTYVDIPSFRFALQKPRQQILNLGNGRGYKLNRSRCFTNLQLSELRSLGAVSWYCAALNPETKRTL